MAVFHFPQFEHESFWEYLSRFNDYRAQYMHFTYEKWEICDAVLEGITHETRGGLCSLDVDDMWDLFESLGINGNLMTLGTNIITILLALL